MIMSYFLLSQGSFSQEWCMRNIMDNERSYMKTLFRFFVAAVFDQLQLSKIRQQRRILDSESQKRLENVVYEEVTTYKKALQRIFPAYDCPTSSEPVKYKDGDNNGFTTWCLSLLWLCFVFFLGYQTSH